MLLFLRDESVDLVLCWKCVEVVHFVSNAGFVVAQAEIDLKDLFQICMFALFVEGLTVVHFRHCLVEYLGLLTFIFDLLSELFGSCDDDSAFA